MRDSEVVASIVAGDPEGLAEAYDRYADPLYKYCRTLLRDPADAADAVQDTFVVAAGRLDGLRDPERLRAWLYAVARNECLRIGRARSGTSLFAEGFDVTDDSADVSREAERADLSALFDDAKDGLNPGDREVIELQLRAGLDPREVADVLGVSANHAHSLLSRAREQLETCLGVLLVSRAGRDRCAELSALLNGWDGRLTILTRKRLHRHIQHCGTCTATRADQLRPAMLLDLTPGAALSAGAVLSFRGAAGAPEGLRGHTLALAGGHGPAAAAHSAAVLSRAGGFSKAGFPKPAGNAVLAGQHSAGLAGRHAAGGLKTAFLPRGLRSAPRGPATAAAAVVIVVAVAVAAFALTGSNQHFTPAAEPRTPGASVLARSAASATAPMPTTPAPATSKPAPGKTKPAPVKTSASPSAKTSASPASTSPSASQSPSSSPSRSPSPTPTPPGTLSASPGGGTASRPLPLEVQVGGSGTQVSLSASGGPVNWSVTVGNDPAGAVSVSPASGTLTPGHPATVTVTVSQYLFCGRGGCPTITLSPGGAVYLIWTGGGPHSHAVTQAPAAQTVSITTLTYPTETRRTATNLN
jgi:RNA polymerase sigma factor (sigma-70 family)